jgi:hypothetical protein
VKITSGLDCGNEVFGLGHGEPEEAKCDECHGCEAEEGDGEAIAVGESTFSG